jgi:ribosomal protein S18 acetylase RimI-like enzyme
VGGDGLARRVAELSSPVYMVGVQASMRALVERALYGPLARANRLSSLRAIKRAVALPWFSFCEANSAAELDCWERAGGALEAELETLRTQCLQKPPGIVAAAATLWQWRVGQASGSSMWSSLGIPGWWLGGVWIHPAVRGMGLGDRLTEMVESRSSTLGHTEIFLNVRVSNSAAITLYNKRGYQVEQQASWRLAIEKHLAGVGHPAPQIVMRKSLAM